MSDEETKPLCPLCNLWKLRADEAVAQLNKLRRATRADEDPEARASSEPYAFNITPEAFDGATPAEPERPVCKHCGKTRDAHRFIDGAERCTFLGGVGTTAYEPADPSTGAPAQPVAPAEMRAIWGGYELHRRPNEAGGYTYTSNEVGGGVHVWDTCCVDERTLRAALAWEHERLSKDE